MPQKPPISFPPKIALVVALAVGLPLVYTAVRWVSMGHVTVTSQIKQAYIIDEKLDQELALPTTLTRLAGRQEFIVSAPGHVDRAVKIVFFPFRIDKSVNFGLEKKLYEEEDAASVAAIPLGRDLPITTAHFDIQLPDESGEYEITLFATLNRPEQLALYRSQLDGYGQEAVAWIKSKGVKPEDLRIVWIPEKPPSISLGRSE